MIRKSAQRFSDKIMLKNYETYWLVTSFSLTSRTAPRFHE